MDYGKNEIMLVDEHDRVTGYEDKTLVHRFGLLHRAFSIFILNQKNELLIQRRAIDKYHSGGLWSNTCCSHGIQNENFMLTVHRRLEEEMGIICKLNWLFRFHYQVDFDNGLHENEIDHVYVGYYNDNPVPDKTEVDEWKWMKMSAIEKDMRANPDAYTYWFKFAFERFKTQSKQEKELQEFKLVETKVLQETK